MQQMDAQRADLRELNELNFSRVDARGTDFFAQTNCEGALDDDEKLIMQEHCYRGYHMLRKIPFLAEAADIVYSHQEKFDGTGYPRGLKGEQIPLGARIFAVADTLDAITSDRPYRAAQTIQAAREAARGPSSR